LSDNNQIIPKKLKKKRKTPMRIGADIFVLLFFSLCFKQFSRLGNEGIMNFFRDLHTFRREKLHYNFPAKRLKFPKNAFLRQFQLQKIGLLIQFMNDKLIFFHLNPPQSCRKFLSALNITILARNCNFSNIPFPPCRRALPAQPQAVWAFPQQPLLLSTTLPRLKRHFEEPFSQP
jgi:hypothetical protein